MSALTPTIVPAEPGWQMCLPRSVWEGDDEKVVGVHYEPVIAWKIFAYENGEHAAAPIAAWQAGVKRAYWLRSPLGQLAVYGVDEDDGVQSFANEADLIKDMQGQINLEARIHG